MTALIGCVPLLPSGEKDDPRSFWSYVSDVLTGRLPDSWAIVIADGILVLGGAVAIGWVCQAVIVVLCGRTLLMARIEIISVANYYAEARQPAHVSYRGQRCELKAGTVFDLCDAELRVGRHPANDLQLPLSNVSRFHFRLVPRGGRYVYEHVAKGQIPTYNGQPLFDDDEHPFAGTRLLADGDTFNAAGVTFRYCDS